MSIQMVRDELSMNIIINLNYHLCITKILQHIEESHKPRSDSNICQDM